MSKGLIERSILTDIANAIRTKTGDSQTYTPSEMGDAILGIPTGSGGGGGPTLLGQTPVKLTEDVDELLLSGSGSYTYEVETDTLFDFDIANGSAVLATLGTSDGYYTLTASSSAAKWYNTYMDITVSGLTVGTAYNFMVDTRGITINDSAHQTQGHWVLYDGSGGTLATRDALHVAGLYNYAFTANTTSVKVRWYPATNSTYSAGVSVAYVKAFYINKANTTTHTGIMVSSGSFIDETTLVAVPSGATITATPACRVYKVPTSGGGGLPLKDRKVVCFGDSLFGLVRGDTSAPAFVASYTGATVYNVGFGGCRMSVHPSHGYAEFSMWALAKAVAENDWTSQDAYASSGSDYFPDQLAILKGINFAAVDYVVIHYGTNDFGGGVAIGADSPATDYTTICGALRYSITKLLTAYPRLRIFVSLPVFRFWDVSGTTVYSDTYTNSQNNTLVQVVEALRGVANEYNIPVIDNYYELGINSANASSFLYDGTHLNAAGRQRFGEYIGSKLLYAGEGGGTADIINHEDLPDYVKIEALNVAKRVQAKLQNDSIVFLTASDPHQIESGDNTDSGTVSETVATNTTNGNMHACMALKALAYTLPLDFACCLGDYTTGNAHTTPAEGLKHIRHINEYLDEAFRDLPQFRTVGNHDPLGYSYTYNSNTALTQAQLYQLIGKYNADSGATMGEQNPVAGYCYRDFSAKNLRVICLNTADTVISSQGGAEAVSAAQKRWFADTLISTPTGYGILILAHHPLDWGNIMAVSHILRAYVEEQSNFNVGGTAYDFTNKNKSAWILQVHGHVHTFTVDNLHYNNSGTGVAYDVKRIALPCMNFSRTNEYGQNAGAEYYGIEFGTPGDTQSKTAGTANDTSFCVFVINPSEQKAYSICYGAGYDRETYWGAVSVPVTGVSLNAASGTLNPGGSIQLTATVAPVDATNKTVIWSSSNTSVATVSGSGLVSAVAVGSATITVTTQDGSYTATYALTVEAVPLGNLISVIGYTDGKRISTSDGTYRDTTGGVVIEYIDLSEYLQQDGTITIRTKGANFKQVNSPYNNNAYVFYNASHNFFVGTYLNGNGHSHSGVNVQDTFADDADNTMTLTISGLNSNLVNNSYHYLRFCGLGSGANIDLRINENFN